MTANSRAKDILSQPRLSGLPYGWRWMFTAVAVPAVFFFVVSLVVPESPRWLVKNGQLDRARQILARIGGTIHAQTELSDIQATLAGEATRHVRYADLLEPGISKPMLIGCVLAALSQWIGINVIFNYAEEIFPNRLRGTAVSVAVSVLWIACFLLTYTFPLLNRTLGPAGTFWTYGAICLGGWVFVWLAVPETKGKTLEEIERFWRPQV